MNKQEKNPDFISYLNAIDYNLIMVHINKARNEEYFYNWSSNAKGWMKGEKIPEHLNSMYKSPLTKSNYK